MTNGDVARAIGLAFHEVSFDPCSVGGLWVCARCRAAYCSPPWSRAEIEAMLCDGQVDSMVGAVPPYTEDDALALRVLVPWLRGKGWFVSMSQSPLPPHRWFFDAEHEDGTMCCDEAIEIDDGPHAIAQGLCAVVVAVAGEA